MIIVKKAEYSDDVVNQMIELSKIWMNENVSFGMVANERSDLKEPCFIALDEDKIIGYAFGHFYESTKKMADIPVGSKCFDYDELYVLKEYRSLGIGKKLFEALEKEAKQKADYITLVTSTKDYRKILTSI